VPCPPEVSKLVERFESSRDDYHSGDYNEARLRQEFVNPLFKALGWDMDNEQGHAEAYKDVIHEDAIKVSGGHKAPDYCFRMAGRSWPASLAAKRSTRARSTSTANVTRRSAARLKSMRRSSPISRRGGWS